MVLKEIRSGRCEATPTLFRPFSPKNSKSFGLPRLRRGVLFCFGGGGSKSRAIQIQNALPKNTKRIFVMEIFLIY
jgi:hypothetical protein